MENVSNRTPDEALKLLKDGNKRFVNGCPMHPNIGMKRRGEVAGGQKPFAVVLTCSDSRVPPKIIFDCGIGDIFVIRVAGNVAGPQVLGSIEYAVTHLKCPLMVVLCHESCGALTAALSSDEQLKDEPENIIKLVRHIRKNIPETLSHGLKEKDAVKAAVFENIDSVAGQIQAEPCMAAHIIGGRLLVKKAYYSLETGVVDWI